MNHGLEVENITAFVKYKPVACFKQFTDEVVDAGERLMQTRGNT